MSDDTPPKIKLINKPSCAGYLDSGVCASYEWTARAEVTDKGRGKSN